MKRFTCGTTRKAMFTTEDKITAYETRSNVSPASYTMDRYGQGFAYLLKQHINININMKIKQKHLRLLSILLLLAGVVVYTITKKYNSNNPEDPNTYGQILGICIMISSLILLAPWIKEKKDDDTSS